METIDFGCQVRVLNRQRLTVTSPHPHGQLSQCAAQFLAKVRQMTAKSSSPDEPWMKLRLSDRGLRIIQHPRQQHHSHHHFRRDEGFESDNSSDELQSASSDSAVPQLLPPDSASGGGSSGVNSSSSDIEEPPESTSHKTSSSSSSATAAQGSLRFRLEDILSCQHPPSLGRHVCLLTLKATDALDILALECSAQEPARILTLLCQKICSARDGVQQPSPSAAESANKPMVVPIQSWSERTKSPDPPQPATNTKSLVSKLERQNSSGWMMTGSSSKATVRRSETTKAMKSSGVGSLSGCSSIISLKTPEAPLRWPAAFRRPISPEEDESVRVRAERRGRSMERKMALPEPAAATPPTVSSPAGSTKIKRDQSKTRSFLMKLTSGARNGVVNKSPTPPAADLNSPSPRRGRSLIRGLRGNSAGQQQPEKTFLVPTKSGQELARNTYPKEVLPNPPHHPVQQQQQQQPIYHLVRPMRTAAHPHWPAAYTWADQHYLNQHDGNNNGWIYFQHPAAAFHHQQQLAAAAAAAAAAANLQQQQLTKSDLKRIQRSRSQSPRR